MPRSFDSAETSGSPRSALEERFLPFLDRHRLPRPHLNVWLDVGPERFQVDCLWPNQRLIAELDSSVRPRYALRLSR